MSDDTQKNDDWKQRIHDYLVRDVREAALADDLDFLDRCAIASMQGMEAANVGYSYEDMAEYAYKQACAMLAERTKRRANRGT